jgi:hypothetical protein
MSWACLFLGLCDGGMAFGPCMAVSASNLRARVSMRCRYRFAPVHRDLSITQHRYLDGLHQNLSRISPELAGEAMTFVHKSSTISVLLLVHVRDPEIFHRYALHRGCVH